MVFAGWIGRFLQDDVRLIVGSEEQPGGPVVLSVTRGSSVALPLGLVNRGHRAAAWVNVVLYVPPGFAVKLQSPPKGKPAAHPSLTLSAGSPSGTPIAWRISGRVGGPLLPGCKLDLTETVRVTVEPLSSFPGGEVIWQVETARRFRSGRFSLSLVDRRLKLVR